MIAKPVIVRGTVPLLVIVADCAALVVPTRCDPKGIVVGVNVTAGAAATPVPVSATACGLPGASSVTVTVAVRVPDAVGAKVTEIVQLAFTASVPVVGQSFVCA